MPDQNWKKQLLALVSDKRVHIATHWDCDGVASGGLIFHLIKKHASHITTISKGDEFCITQKDIPPNTDILICSDIQPGLDVDPHTVIYIDHHPCAYKDIFALTIHDEHIQSCSLLIWQELLQDSADAYLHFLTLLGFFGDGGVYTSAPAELQIRAQKYFPHLVIPRKSTYSNKMYVPLEMYVSLFNVGKRMHWNGNLPFELVKQVTDYNEIVLAKHPLVDELQRCKHVLRDYYNQPVTFEDAPKVKYAIISCDKNIQGVICSRYLKDKPVLVLNQYNGNVIASLRVPEDLDFDAGIFLSAAKHHVPDVIGGGHAKAGGITFPRQHLSKFMTYIHQTNSL